MNKNFKIIKKEIKGFLNHYLNGIIEFFHRIFLLPLLERRINKNIDFYPETNKVLFSKEIGSLQLFCKDLAVDGYPNLGAFYPIDESIDWHFDKLSKFRWPISFYKNYTFSEIYPPADIKMPWEINRCQHWPNLTLNYILTKNYEYLETLFSQWNDWIGNNNYLYGVNWTCAMEVAIRASNWLLTLELLGGIKEIPEVLRRKVHQYLCFHGVFIEKHLEIYRGGVTTNHTISDYLGLFYLGAALQPSAMAKKWFQMGWNGLCEEIEKQVADDGVDYETSTYYHRLVFELFFYGYLIAKKTEVSIPKVYYNRLKKMAKFVEAYIRPDGLATQIGDNDNGRLFVLSPKRDVRDHRYLLWLASLEFENISSIGNNEPPIEAVLFLDKETDSEANIKQFVSNESKIFRKSGFIVLKSNRIWTLISAHLCGTNGMGNHTHNDLGGFELCVDHKPILVDPGSYIYTRNPRERYNFRKTSAHNTLIVDQVEQNPIDETLVFGMPRPYIEPTILHFEDNCEFTKLVLRLDGYQRLSDPVLHMREFLLTKNTNELKLKDKLLTLGKHNYQWFFHFDYGVSLELRENSIKISDQLSLSWTGFEEASVFIKDDWVSYSYNQKLPSKTLVVNSIIHGNTKVVWKISVQ